MFIDRLNEALHKKNISGNMLCKILKMPNANYTNWKKQTPKGETLKQIADALNVSVDWLLEREDAPEPDEVQLIKNYQVCDEEGKETIISVAELQAKRCKKAAAWKPDDNKEQKEQDELKPFA